MLSRQIKRLAVQQNIQWMAATRYSTQAELKVKKDKEPIGIDLQNARPFEEIPGPSKFEFLRSILPGGYLYKKSLNDIILILNERYGQLFRIPGVFGNPNTFMTMNPDDYSIIFRNEGIWPNRRPFKTLIYHREVHRPEVFGGVLGVVSTNNEQWAEVRTAINPVLMQPKNARLYLNTMLEVNDEFLQRIREIRDPLTHEMPNTFEDEINRLTFESVAAVALNTQLGLIRKNRDTEEAKMLIASIRKFFDLTFDLEIMPPIWKYVKIPAFKEMMKSLDTLTDICIKYINQTIDKIEHDNKNQTTTDGEGKEKSVLEKLLKIDRKIAVVMALDMMMAGVDTTSSVLTGILLCIAKNPEKQAKLLEELKHILPQKDSRLTLDNMRNLPYLRACIKEGIRIYPIGAGTLRSLPHDVVLSGYWVRKGSDISTGGNLQLCDEKYMPRAKEFLPERWLRNDQDSGILGGSIANSFMYLPFGFGPRLCAGKRVVDLELEITVVRLVRNFNIEFNYSTENAFRSKLINVPNIPLKFKFEERSN